MALTRAFPFCIAVLCSAQAPGDWPKWRGPFDAGVARSAAPLKWTDKEHVRWKVAIPGLGNSSPVMWGDKIFLTTAVPGGAGGAASQTEHRLVVLCLDRKTGKTLWEKTARTVKPHEGYHQRYGSYASNSPVTDGKRLYAFFGSNGAYAYDLDGKLLWEWDSGIRMRMRNAFGEGTAAVLHNGTLLFNFDHEGEDALFAVDAATGKTRWKADRQESSNWAAPLVVEHGGTEQVIVPASGKVRAYNLKDGGVIWECAGLGANTIPAPVHANGIVYVMSGFRSPNLLAIRLGGKGDLTGTDAILWTTTRGTSYTPSPVLHQGKLYMLTDSGMLSCLDAATGKPYYERVRLPKPYNFKSSPVAAGGHLYMASEEGDVIVVKLGETFEVAATNTMADQMFIATPAVSDGAMYLRSQTHLFAIAQ